MFIRIKALHRGLAPGGVTMAVFAAGQRAGLGTIYAHRQRMALLTACGSGTRTTLVPFPHTRST